jgi:hypothetical protein
MTQFLKTEENKRGDTSIIEGTVTYFMNIAVKNMILFL